MALKIQGDLLVEAARDQMWTLLFDPETLKLIANRVPGVSVERLVQTGEDHYEGTANIGVAMIKGKYDGTITVLEKRAPEFVKFRGEGKSGANWANGDMALTLAEQDGKTLMHYEGTGNVGGMLASVGQRLIDTVGKQLLKNGTKALAEELSARTRAPETPE